MSVNIHAHTYARTLYSDTVSNAYTPCAHLQSSCFYCSMHDDNFDFIFKDFNVSNFKYLFERFCFKAKIKI